MLDEEIIKLFFERSEEALKELETKYGKMCMRTSYNILGNYSDAEESVNDSYLSVWNAIPPVRPAPLLTYVLKIVRNEIGYRRTLVDGSKPKTSRIPVYPAEWQNQFGLSYKEHRQSMQIDFFDGYAVYAIKDNEDSSEPIMYRDQSIDVSGGMSHV